MSGCDLVNYFVSKSCELVFNVVFIIVVVVCIVIYFGIFDYGISDFLGWFVVYVGIRVVV